MRQLLRLLAILMLVPFVAMCATTKDIGDPNEIYLPPGEDAAPAFQPPPSADGAGGACADLSCNKVDILFVVDNSISMGSAQEGLRQAFPTFFEKIKTQLQGTDFHLMVVDSDYAGSETVCHRLCPSVGFDASIGPDQGACTGFPCSSIAERGACDSALGAGVVYPLGGAASNRNCNFPEGRRYLKSTDDDLEERFLCSAAVGTYGDGNERPIGAMLAALEVESRPGNCNDGFLRDDALLVVVIVSDAGSTAAELDSSNVAGWRERLLALKCGREEGVVVMTVTHDGVETAPWYAPMFIDGYLPTQWNSYCALVPNDPCCCGPDYLRQVCPECASHPPPWKQCWFYFTGYGTPLVRFAELFGERGVHREICDDFSDILDNTLEAVKKACTVL